MSLFDFWRSDNFSLTQPLSWFSYGTSSAGEAVTNETAMRLTAVWSCVRVISETIGSLPLQVYKRVDEGKEKATDHPLYRILHDEPNQYMTSVEYIESKTAAVTLTGNAYSEIRRSKGAVTALIPLNPLHVRPKIDENGQLIYEVSVHAGQNKVLKRDQVLHIKGFGMDGLKGLSPIEYCAETIGTSIAMDKHTGQKYEDGLMTSGVLTIDHSLTKEQRAQWRENVKETAKGSGVLILEAGAKFQGLSMSHKDAEFIESRKYQIQDISRIFRVPPHMISELSDATFSNIEHQGLEFLKYTLRPYLTRWEKSINNSLFSAQDRKKYFVEFNLDALLRGDSEARGNFYTQMIANGVYNIDEVRAFENKNKIKHGDVHRIQMQNIPIGEADEQLVQNTE